MHELQNTWESSSTSRPSSAARTPYLPVVLRTLMRNISSQVTSHIGRSYVFALNNLMSIDAFPAGNGARFINHSPSDEANVGVSSTSCSPHSFIPSSRNLLSPRLSSPPVLLVHGEHRIGVFASESVLVSALYGMYPDQSLPPKRQI